jgi:threonine dehydrogenase-like Zn-dependent dehydrogenase
MIEPLANSFHMAATALSHTGPRPSALLLGGGTLGACTAAASAACGLEIAAVSEPSVGRCRIMSALGIAEGIDPTKEDLPERCRNVFGVSGPDVVFDCVGTQATRQAAATLVASGGIVVLLGLHDGETTIGFHDVVRREVRLQGSFAYTDNNFADSAQFVEGGSVDFSPWSRLEGLENAQAAFDLVASSPDDVLKVALRP